MSCYGCEKRHVGCHVDCEDYIQETKQIKEKKEKIKTEKIKEGEIIAVEKTRTAKRNKWKL